MVQTNPSLQVVATQSRGAWWLTKKTMTNNNSDVSFGLLFVLPLNIERTLLSLSTAARTRHFVVRFMHVGTPHKREVNRQFGPDGAK